LGFLSFTYISYKNQYQKDIDKYVENEVQLYKKELFSSIHSANKKFEQKRKLFYQIHKAALKIFQKDMETPLLKVQQQLKDMFNLNRLNIQIYLIDKNYTIFKTTFPRDLGFNLSIAPDAKYYLDKTTQDGKIYVSKFASNDFIYKRYKLYTYSKLDDKTYLELGFIDNNLINEGIEIISAESNSKNKIRLYFIAKNSNEYFYHEAAFSKKIENKQHFINEVKKIPIESNSNDPVINAILQKRTIKFQRDNKVIVYTPIFKEDMSNIIIPQELRQKNFC
jgi:hypothetical protein